MSEHRPIRIQRRRTKGWKAPEGAIYVGRPSKWENPVNFRDCSADIGPEGWARGVAVDLFRKRLLRRDEDGKTLAITIADVREELHNHDLMCWCPLDQPCHADVLLEIANYERA